MDQRSVARPRGSIMAAVVWALLVTACGDGDKAATNEAAAVSTAATPASTTAATLPAETTTTGKPVETTTTTTVPSETTTTTMPTVSAPPDGTIYVTLTDFEFSPVSAAVASGEPIVVELENRSSQTHTWALLTAGSRWTTWKDFDLGQILAATQGIPADGTDTLQFTAPEPGTYQVVCTVRGHIQRGMVAELVVTG